MSALPTSVEIVEVGPRDGLQDEHTVVTTDDKIAYTEAIVRAGVRRVEIASFVNPKRVPQMADAEAMIPAATGLLDADDAPSPPRHPALVWAGGFWSMLQLLVAVVIAGGTLAYLLLHPSAPPPQPPITIDGPNTPPEPPLPMVNPVVRIFPSDTSISTPAR